MTKRDYMIQPWAQDHVFLNDQVRFCGLKSLGFRAFWREHSGKEGPRQKASCLVRGPSAKPSTWSAQVVCICGILHYSTSPYSLQYVAVPLATFRYFLLLLILLIPSWSLYVSLAPDHFPHRASSPCWAHLAEGKSCGGGMWSLHHVRPFVRSSLLQTLASCIHKHLHSISRLRIQPKICYELTLIFKVCRLKPGDHKRTKTIWRRFEVAELIMHFHELLGWTWNESDVLQLLARTATKELRSTSTDHPGVAAAQSVAKAHLDAPPNKPQGTHGSESSA